MSKDLKVATDKDRKAITTIIDGQSTASEVAERALAIFAAATNGLNAINIEDLSPRSYRVDETASATHAMIYNLLISGADREEMSPLLERAMDGWENEKINTGHPHITIYGALEIVAIVIKIGGDVTAAAEKLLKFCERIDEATIEVPAKDVGYRDIRKYMVEALCTVAVKFHHSGNFPERDKFLEMVTTLKPNKVDNGTSPDSQRYELESFNKERFSLLAGAFQKMGDLKKAADLAFKARDTRLLAEIIPRLLASDPQDPETLDMAGKFLRLTEGSSQYEFLNPRIQIALTLGRAFNITTSPLTKALGPPDKPETKN